MDNLTEVYVIIAKDRQGKPRGFEKSTERFYLIESEAYKDWDKMDLKEFFMVVPCLIRQYKHGL